MFENFIEILQINNPYFIIISGLMIGLLHAFEPDHLSAVSTQLFNEKKHDAKQRRRFVLRKITINSSVKGALWGMGHTSSILFVGLLVAGLSLNIPNNFFVGAELIVGFMLIFLGILVSLNKSILKQKHVHPHQHKSGISHTHPHTHDGEHRHGHKSYVIGCIHGLAGSGSLVALTASSLNSFEMIIYFLVLFGAGSIIGMTVASGLLGIPFVLLSKINSGVKYLRYATAVVALIIGTNIVYTIILGENLFLPS